MMTYKQRIEIYHGYTRNQLIAWDDITSDDVVVTPAFGTTIEIQELLEKGVSGKI